MSLTRTLALLLCLLALPASALAHRVNIFAYVDGQNVVADCFYSKSSKVNAGKITVTNAATGEEYLRATTDAEGAASFPVPAKAIAERADLKLVLVAGEGHQGEILVRASEFAALSAKTPAAKPADKPVKEPKAAPAGAAPAPAALALDEARLAAVVEAAVDRAVEARLAPVKRLLAENVKQGPGPTEIIGGIGYIVGIFGVAAFVAGRRKNGKDS